MDMENREEVNYTQKKCNHGPIPQILLMLSSEKIESAAEENLEAYQPQVFL